MRFNNYVAFYKQYLKYFGYPPNRIRTNDSSPRARAIGKVPKTSNLERSQKIFKNATHPNGPGRLGVITIYKIDLMKSASCLPAISPA